MRRTSADAKAAILRAARERFAEDGYDRATIRAIAADAGIDPAMVMRYFGSKDQLFTAATDFDLKLPDMGAVPPDRLGAMLTTHFLDLWEHDESFQILLRSSVTNPAVGEQMRQIFATQLVPAIAALAADEEVASRRAGLAASQVLGMALCRYILCLPPITAMDRDDVIAWIGPTLQRYLTGSPGST